MTRNGLMLAAAVCLAGCASTKFVSSGKAPDAQPVSFQGQKVAALVISPHESTRLGAEGVLARELTKRGMIGVPAFNLIPPNESRDKEKAKTLFNAAGVAGVVVMRAVGSEKEYTSTPGYWSSAYYGSFWGGGAGYYGYGWGAVYEPGYLRTDTIVRVETLVYDLKADKLLWAGLSETTNPDKVETLVQNLVTAAAAEVKKQGLVAPR
jgi:hypothetical protein